MPVSVLNVLSFRSGTVFSPSLNKASANPSDEICKIDHTATLAAVKLSIKLS